jgi:hypothetical protein
MKIRAERLGANIGGTISTGDDEGEIELISYTGAEYILHPRGFYQIRSDEKLNAEYEQNIQDNITSHYGPTNDP